MPKFLVLYRANHSASEQMASATPEQAQAGMDAWMTWSQQAGSALVDLGAPLGDPKTVGEGRRCPGTWAATRSWKPAPSMRSPGCSDAHPHLQTPGGASIEVRELLAMPGA
jgi:hypothetical protein